MEAARAEKRLRFTAVVFHHLCAIKIQRRLRAHWALESAKKQINSVVTIQVKTTNRATSHENSSLESTSYFSFSLSDGWERGNRGDDTWRTGGSWLAFRELSDAGSPAATKLPPSSSWLSGSSSMSSASRGFSRALWRLRYGRRIKKHEHLGSADLIFWFFCLFPLYSIGSVESSLLPPKARQCQTRETKTSITSNFCCCSRGRQTVQQDVLCTGLPPSIQTLLLHSRGPQKLGCVLIFWVDEDSVFCSSVSAGGQRALGFCQRASGCMFLL